MKLQKKGVFSFLIIACLLLLGFYRDFLFKNINALLKAWDYEMAFTMPASLSFCENFEYSTLVRIKWLLTIVFCLLYLIISVITIHFLFPAKISIGNNRYVKIAIFVYIVLAGVSGLLMAYGYVFPQTSSQMYEFARYLMGMAQSPIVLMVLIPAFKISEKETTKITN